MTRAEKVETILKLMAEMNDEEVHDLMAALKLVYPSEPKRYIKVKDLALMLGIGINQAYAMSHRADFYPAVQVSEGRIVIDTQLLSRWME